MFRNFTYLLGFFLLMGCASTTRKEAKLLTMDAAARRVARVSNVHYDLMVKLDGSKDSFEGTVVVTFSLKGSGRPLTVDFVGGKVLSLTSNGTEVKKPDYKGNFVVIPANTLKEGANRVLIGYSHPFSTTGAGLYKFKDPIDGRIYTYTDFEPFDSNQLFPNFDQPDIKARYTLTVEAPRNWVVSGPL